MINRFQKWALAATIATYLLILVGSLVRASGSGLGCPDWPTCFGKPYPPFTYEEFLKRDIPDDFDRTDFHVGKAWIEYTNRFTGSIIGLLLIGTLVYALRDYPPPLRYKEFREERLASSPDESKVSLWAYTRYYFRNKNKRILYPTIGAFVSVMINGWLGGEQIKRELDPRFVTAHLVLALVQVTLLIYATVSAFYPEGGLPEPPRQRKLLARGAYIVLFLALIQAGLGADLRGQLEKIEKENPQIERGDLIVHADWVDQVHRSFSWAILFGVFWLYWYTQKESDMHHWLKLSTQIAAGLVLLQIVAGIGLAYIALPPPLQPIHTLSATLTIGALMVIGLLATRLPLVEKMGDAAQPAELQTAAGD